MQSQLGREGLGLRRSSFSPPEGPLVPIIPCAIACSFPLWGWVNRAPEAVCFSPLPAEASLLPWLEVDVFPSWFEVDVFPPWFEADVFHLDQRLVGFHPATFQRLQLPGSQFGLTSAGEVIHLVGPQVLWVPVALGGEGRPGAGPTVPVSSDSSL